MPNVYMNEVPRVQTVGADGIGVYPPVPTEKVDKRSSAGVEMKEVQSPAGRIPNPQTVADGSAMVEQNDAWSGGANLPNPATATDGMVIAVEDGKYVVADASVQTDVDQLVAQPYSPSELYNKDDYAVYENQLYRCKQDINPSEEFNPAHWDATDALAEIAGKADVTAVEASMASEYSSKTYKAGEYCYHDGTLYRCKSDIDTAEAWTAAHWEAAKLADDCSALKTAITQLDGVAYKATGNLLDFGFIGGTWEQGNIGNSNPYLCKTKRIPVEAGKTLYGVINRAKMQKTTALSTFTMTLYVTVYDANDTVLNQAVNMGSSQSQQTGSIELSSESSYAIAVLSTGIWGNQVTPSILDNAVEAFAYLGYDNISKDDVVPNYIPYPEYNNEEIEKIKTKTDLIDDTLVYDVDEVLELTGIAGIVSKAGSVNTGSDSFIHYDISVSEGEVYRITSYEQGSESYPQVLYYNDSNQIIGYEETTDGGYYTRLIKIPKNVTKVCVNGIDTIKSATQICSMKVTNTQNYIDLEVSNNFWTGKKIVWFGTSIPAGVINAGLTNGNGSYPARVGQMLGATVYNESIGSSRVRGGNYHAISAEDPMGWSGCEALGVMLSMSLSRAEKQAIIDDWDSKWKDIMLQPSQYDSSQVNTYLNSSWDTILTKYLTGGSVGQCDLYVFDHGYNDGVVTYGFTDLDEIPTQEDDRTYWWGGMNFLISKILSDNPKAKILIVGHYNYSDDPSNRGENWSGKYVCDAQKAYADSWGFNCIETWKLLGLSMNEITVDGTSTPVIYARYPDHIHPASDTTGYELKRYADALAPYFKLACST